MLPGMTTNHNEQLTTGTKPLTKLKLDRQGGAVLRVADLAVLRLQQRALRFLHITAGPQLRELDLSRCAPGLDLTLEACPLLRRIRLPAATPGAVVHLNCGDNAPRLEILGTIQTLDACWQDGDFAVDAGHAPPLLHARLGRSVRSQVAEHAIQVEHGSAVPPLLAYPADSPLRQLLVLDAPRLTAIHLPAGRVLERVQVSGCPALDTLQGGDVYRLRLDRCGALRDIGIGGHAATLAQGTGAVEGLRLGRPWSHLTLSSSRARRLECAAVGQLLLRDCPDLLSAQVADSTAVALSGDTCVALGELSRLRLDERAIAGLLVKAEAGGTLALNMLSHWCAHARRPWEYLETLRALAAAEADAGWLWQLRCRLHARCNLGRGALPETAGCHDYALRHWDWRFPPDRYLEGWEADLALWRRARRDLPQLARMLDQAPPLLAVAALARQLGEGPLPAAELRQLASAVVQARPPRRRADAELPGAERVALEALASAAVTLRSAALADALVERLQQQAQAGRHVPVLATLAAFGHAGARVTLMRLAQIGPPEQRAQVLALALAPMRSTVLAVWEGEHA